MKLWTNKLFMLALVVALALSIGAFLACDDDDDDDDDEVDDDLWEDDDEADDDVVIPDDDVVVDDDTVIDDDTVDDDDVIGDGPVLSGGLWDPTTMITGDFGLGEDYWYSTLIWSVCDLDNDLLPDGVIYFYQAGTTNAFFVEQPIDWTEFHDPPDSDLADVGDCDNPVACGINALMGPVSAPPPAGNYCVDIEATDSAGNFSNLIENLCVIMAK